MEPGAQYTQIKKFLVGFGLIKTKYNPFQVWRDPKNIRVTAGSYKCLSVTPGGFSRDVT